MSWLSVDGFNNQVRLRPALVNERRRNQERRTKLNAIMFGFSITRFLSFPLLELDWNLEVDHDEVPILTKERKQEILKT